MGILQSLGTIARSLFAIGILLLCVSAIPMLSWPSILIGIALCLALGAIDIWAVMGMRRGTRETRSLRSDIMASSTAMILLIISAGYRSLAMGPVFVDGVMALLAAWFGWRIYRALKHLKNGTHPTPTSSITDARRMLQSVRDAWR